MGATESKEKGMVDEAVFTGPSSLPNESDQGGVALAQFLSIAVRVLTLNPRYQDQL